MEKNITRIKNLIQKKFAGKSDNFLETHIFETDMVVSLSVRIFVEKLFKLDNLLNMLYQIDDAFLPQSVYWIAIMKKMKICRI